MPANFDITAGAGLRGLLVDGAAAVATLGGGLRRGSGQDAAAVLTGDALSVAAWGERLLAAGSFGPEGITCRVALSSADEVDVEVIGWLRAAYEATKE